MKRDTPIWATGVVFLLLIQGLSIAQSIPVDSNVPISPQSCHDEGKDITCSHFKSTLAALMAQNDSPFALVRESDLDTDIIHCFLNLEIDPNTKVISGTNTVTVKSLTSDLLTFTLDLRDNMIVDSVTGTVASYSRVGHTIEMTLDRPYTVDESFTVTIAYHGIPENLGFSSFNWSTHNDVAVFATNCEPWFAHTWWPCKDSLVDKFTLDMWVTVPSWMIANSNGILTGTDSITGDKTRYRWQTSYPIAAYLVSLSGTNYVHWTYDYNHPGGTMPVAMYAYPESEASARTNTSSLVTQIQTFSRPDVFGQYPFVNEKYGITQVPSGGMENQTLSSQGSFSTWLNAHELAHQWWGDMVTCATWHDIWLNEGFATYAEAVYEEKKPGGSYSSYLARLQVRRPSNYSGTVYVYDTTDVSVIFDHTNVYNKAAWVLHMLRHVVGNTNFFNILAAYRNAFEGGSATTEDFSVVAESIYGGDLQWFFDQWVYTGGAPYYRYGWQQEQIGSQNWLRLCIQQYQSSGKLFRMPIDITAYTGSTSVTHSIWNTTSSQWFLLKTDAPLTSIQFDKNTWILRGAAGSVSYVPGPAKIIDTLPAPGQNVYAAADANHVVIQFSDAITYRDSDIAVIGNLSGPQAFSSSYSASDYTLTLTFTQPLPENETWTVTVADGILTQLSGYAIDGELAPGTQPFPSGDGVPGGDTVFSFYVGYTADIQRDGKVNLDDFALFASHWLQTGCGLCNGADLTGDGNVDTGDLIKFTASWLSGTSSFSAMTSSYPPPGQQVN